MSNSSLYWSLRNGANEAPATPSALPRHAPREVKVDAVAREVAYSTEGDRTAEDFHSLWLESWGKIGRYLSLEFHSYLPELYEEVWRRIHEVMSQGKVFQSESSAVNFFLVEELRSLFGDFITVSDWVPGEKVMVPIPKAAGTEGRASRSFLQGTLTGGACPKCLVNPQVSGYGGGVRCLDEVNCGWWYCA